MKKYCVLPCCTYCKERLSNKNGTKKANGYFDHRCKLCKKEIAYIRRNEYTSMKHLNKKLFFHREKALWLKGIIRERLED